MDITRHNFSENIKQIEDSLLSCVFISLDMEYTGLSSDETTRNSLFDTSSKRYNLIKNTTIGITATQVGVSAFRFDRNSNTYKASTYTFHIRPQAIGDVRQICTFQASALNFLCDHKFDFNKVFYDGLPYLNEIEEDTFLQNMNSDTISSSKSFEENDQLQEAHINIIKWMESANKNNDNITFSGTYLFCYLLTAEIRAKYPKLVVTLNGQKVEVKRHCEKQDISAKSTAEDRSNFINSILGFSLVVKILKKAKKPIVLHNAFMDLILYYKLFVRPLPKTYDQFKSEIHKIFPSIFDSKYISDELKFIIKKEDYSDSSKLETDAKGRYLALHSPCIVMNDNFDPTPCFHQAGWDSFCTGYCFIRLGHWAACKQLIGTDQVLSSTQHIHALSQFCNTVCLSRAAQPYTCLDKADPKCHRPQHLFVKIISDTIDLPMISRKLSQYGSIDVMKYGPNTALVAVSNQICAKKILNEFKSSKDLKIACYDVLQHSPVARLALWSGLLLCSGSLVALIVHQIKT